ncbi:MAG: histidinol-phosphatase [Clostridiales bacterium]|jgi:histidinol-phosphatase (PHP family)|nr:histidinol-phosphatase [Clostridiales bacterium]
MIASNLHTHTTFCDGQNTPVELAEAAFALGFRSLGFSGHGYVSFDRSCGMSPDESRAYRAAITELKARYRGRLDIFLGLENDAAELCPTADYDYTLGAVHYVPRGGVWFSVDADAAGVGQAVEEAFGGDGLAFAEAYFETVARFASERRADILAHIDLVRRHNTGGVKYFDEDCAAYRRAALDALEQAVRAGYLIEVSTAPIAKGISKEPYPALFLLRRAQELGASLVVGSDAHTAANLNFRFAETEALLREIGFSERWELTPRGFEAVPLQC